MAHPIVSFLRNSPDVVMPRGSGGGMSADTNAVSNGMPWERFKDLVNWYCEKNKAKDVQWTKQASYMTALQDQGVKRCKLDATMAGAGVGTVEYDGMLYDLGTEWVMGVTGKRSGSAAAAAGGSAPAGGSASDAAAAAASASIRSGDDRNRNSNSKKRPLSEEE